jgi:hypothetical protein
MYSYIYALLLVSQLNSFSYVFTLISWIQLSYLSHSSHQTVFPQVFKSTLFIFNATEFSKYPSRDVTRRSCCMSETFTLSGLYFQWGFHWYSKTQERALQSADAARLWSLLCEASFRHCGNVYSLFLHLWNMNLHVKRTTIMLVDEENIKTILLATLLQTATTHSNLIHSGSMTEHVKCITHLSSSVVSLVLISGNLSVLSIKTIIS